MGNKLCYDSMNAVASFFSPEKIVKLAMMVSRVSKSMQLNMSRFKLNDRTLLPFLEIFINFTFHGKYNHTPCMIWDMNVIDLWSNEDMFRGTVMTLPWVMNHFQQQFRRLVLDLDISPITLSVFMQQSCTPYPPEYLITNDFAFNDLPSNIHDTLLSNEGKIIVRNFLLGKQIDNCRHVPSRARQSVINLLQCTTLDELKISAYRENMQFVYNDISPAAHLEIVEEVFRTRYFFLKAGHKTKRTIESHNLMSLDFWKRMTNEYNEEVFEIMRRGQLHKIETEYTKRSHFKTLKQCKDKAVQAWKKRRGINGRDIKCVITNMINDHFMIITSKKLKK